MTMTDGGRWLMNLAELLTTDDLALGFELNDAATLRRKPLASRMRQRSPA